MNTRTLCLDVLVLVSVAFPGQAFRLALTGAAASRAATPGAAAARAATPGAAASRPGAPGPPARRAGPQRWRRAAPELGFAAALAAVAALGLLAVPDGPPLAGPPHPGWYAVAAAAGLLAPVAEYLLGAAVLRARGRRPGRLALHERAGTGAPAVLAALVAAVAEEVVFRALGIGLLAGGLGLAVPAAVAVTAVAYGLNHLYYGWLTVAQKTLTGLGLGALFVAAGHSLWVAAAAHGALNLAVLLLVPRWSRR
ncbi:MAG TPA: CPBP family glutamic-type intramembrane protease [Pilimelia sp.]|nr:CPBP family glutamic-type intramembrane protease [Pilimelia sp.]